MRTDCLTVKRHFHLSTDALSLGASHTILARPEAFRRCSTEELPGDFTPYPGQPRD
jgi:hypothetical protein